MDILANICASEYDSIYIYEHNSTCYIYSSHKYTRKVKTLRCLVTGYTMMYILWYNSRYTTYTPTYIFGIILDILPTHLPINSRYTTYTPTYKFTRIYSIILDILPTHLPIYLV